MTASKLVFVFVCLLASASSTAQTYTVGDEGSAISFKVKNLGVYVDGEFTGLKGLIIFDPQDLSRSNFNVSVRASTVSTGISLRDKHLRKKEYFDAEAYPDIRFVSTSIVELKAMGAYQVEGTLMLKGISRNITFPFSVRKVSNSQMFVGSFEINRTDYHVGGGSVTMGDVVKISLAVLATPMPHK
jgi:polyisoprenoid-binding protein YceI